MSIFPETHYRLRVDTIEVVTTAANVATLAYIIYTLHVEVKKEQKEAVIEALKLANGELVKVITQALKSEQVENMIKEIVKHTLEESEMNEKIDRMLRKLCKYYDEFCDI